jgi:hypothetical protein
VVPVETAAELREQGIVLLRDVFQKEALLRLKQAAERCFEALGQAQSPPDQYRFNRFSHSLLLTALRDFGVSEEELLGPLSVPGLGIFFSAAMGRPCVCNLEQSWLRKKFAPRNALAAGYHPQEWHQDGALGVRFPLKPGPALPMTELLTFWIPLNPCGEDSPGLEFIRSPQPALLHFTELDDTALRRRFPAHDFWSPGLYLGDGLIFLNSVLHRTCTRPEMLHNRLSVEYRIFANPPTCQPPQSGANSLHLFQIDRADSLANNERKNS